MAKEKETAETVEKVEKTDRELRWELFLEAYKVKNPSKYEARLAAGELNKIPESFK